MEETHVNDLRILQDRIAQMEQEAKERDTQLELRHKAQMVKHRMMLGLVVVGMGITMMAKQGTTQGTPQSLTVRSLKVVDAKGFTLVTLGADVNDGGQISVYGSTGKKVASLGTSVKGNGGAWFFDAEGKTQHTSIGINQNGQGVVTHNALQNAIQPGKKQP